MPGLYELDDADLAAEKNRRTNNYRYIGAGYRRNLKG